MKRYWKLTTLLIFIIAIFSTFYIQIAMAKRNLPEFEFVAVSGDEEYLDRFVLYGDYVKTDEVWEPFKLTADGIKYKKELNYLQQFSPFHRPQSIQQLYEEERKFMRGRGDYWYTYAEDGDLLVHVNPVWSTTEINMEIDVLDRGTGKITSFSLTLPDYDTMADIQNVQLHGEIVYLFVRSENGTGKNELNVYEVSLSEEKILDKTLLAETDSRNSIYVLNSVENFSPEEYIIYKINHVNSREDGDYYEIEDEELYSYHLKSGEKSMIEMPDGFSEFVNDPYGEESFILPGYINIGKEHVYFVEIDTEGIDYYTYSLAEKEMGEKTTVMLDEAVLEGMSQAFPFGEEMFLYSEGEDQQGIQFRKVIAIDLKEASQTFEGSILLKKSPKETMVYDMEMYDIQIRR